LVFVD
jgi:hypothetical protein